MSASISQSIERGIAAAASCGVLMTEITLSKAAALDLAKELAELQLTKKLTSADIYKQMKSGGTQFMGLPIVITNTPQQS